MHLNQLRYKAVAELGLVLREPLHVGSGEVGVRRALLRIGGQVVVPSSTWKGALRCMAESIARSMTPSLSRLERLAVACYAEEPGGITYKWDEKRVGRIFSDTSLRDLRAEYEEALNEFRNHLEEQLGGWSKGSRLEQLGEELTLMLDVGYESNDLDGSIREGDVTDLFSEYLAAKCPIGSLFGNGVLAGKVRPMDSVLGSLLVETRPGVGIDRRSGRSRTDILHFTDVVPAGTEVGLMLVADNLQPGSSDSRILAGILEWIRELGLQVGGRKSVGLGLLELRDARLWAWELGVDSDSHGEVLVNPFKRGEPLSLERGISWLRGAAGV